MVCVDCSIVSYRRKQDDFGSGSGGPLFQFLYDFDKRIGGIGIYGAVTGAIESERKVVWPGVDTNCYGCIHNCSGTDL